MTSPTIAAQIALVAEGQPFTVTYASSIRAVAVARIPAPLERAQLALMVEFYDALTYNDSAWAQLKVIHPDTPDNYLFKRPLDWDVACALTGFTPDFLTMRDQERNAQL